MNFFEKIRNIFKKKEIQQIDEAEKYADDEGVIVIPIDFVKKIIKNEDKMFEIIEKAKKDDEIFSNGYIKSQYIDAIVIYVNFVNNKGVQFNKSELKRIHRLTGLKIKNKSLKLNSV